MHGGTDGSAWTDMTMDAFFYLWDSLLFFFSLLPPLLDIALESIMFEYFGAPPSEEGNNITTLSSPAFDIPKSWSIIPDFKNNSVHSCCGTFTWSDWYYPPFTPYSRTPWIPELLQIMDGHMEVALVFVDVLQGFEIFVHRTEMLQQREATVDRIEHTSIIPKSRWRHLTSFHTILGVEECSGWTVPPGGWMRVLHCHTKLPLLLSVPTLPRCSTISLHLISTSVTHTHTQKTRIITISPVAYFSQ